MTLPLPGNPVADPNIQQKFDAISLNWTSGTYDPWHVVGAAGQPAFANGWGNVGAGYGTAAFFKDPAGIVHVRGFVTAGTLNTGVFTLPAGYRPLLNEIFAEYQNGAFCAIQVLSTGVVQQLGGAANVNLSIGCRFRGEA